MHVKKVKNNVFFARSRVINKLFHIGRYFRAIYRPISGDFIGRYLKYQPFFATNYRANDFPISYRHQAKKEISDDISADSADI